MLTLLPLASSFHSDAQVREAVAGIGAALEGRGIVHRMLTAPGDAHALLIVTGGTEHLALGALEGHEGPVLLLAHPRQNSLPAAMEVLCRLRQEGRAGRILLLNDGEEGYTALARVADHLAVRGQLRATRLGRIGAPSDWLVGSMPDPAEVTATWGPQVVDVPMEAVHEAIRDADPEEADALRRDFCGGAASIVEPTARDLDQAARVGAGLRAVVRAYDLDACSVRCFDLVTGMATTGCLALSALLDQGIVAGCEGDVPAALTMLWMQAVSGGPGFMANPQDLDPGTSTLWMAHCTVPRGLVSRYTLRSHFESGLGVGIQGHLPEGPVTLARIGGPDLRGLFLSDGELLANGDSPQRCRTQVQVRLRGSVAPMLENPMGNHHVLVPGHWEARLREYHALCVQG